MGLFKKKDKNYYLDEYRKVKRGASRGDAAALLLKAGELGSELAAVTLGRNYLYGDEGFEQDYDKAIEWLIKAAKDSVFYMGDDLEFAWKKAGRAGAPPVKSTAVKGDEPDSEDFYYKQSLEAKASGDQWEEMKWLIMAAKDNNALARCALAKKYTQPFHRIGPRNVGKEDFDKADEWFQRAVDIGYINAYCSWGFAHSKKGDKERAFELYTKGANLGDMYCQYNLAGYYNNGTACEKDEEKAVFWYRKSADQGYGSALNNLGFCYENGTGGLEKSDEIALSWYRKAEEAGDSYGLYNIGRFYFEGRVVEKDLFTAIDYYEKSAQKRNPLACYALGEFYSKNDSRDKKLDALAWFVNALNYGYKSDDKMNELLTERYDLNNCSIDTRGYDQAEVEEFEKLAEKGNTASMVFCYKMYTSYRWNKKASKYYLLAEKAGVQISWSKRQELYDKMLEEAEEKYKKDWDKYQREKNRDLDEQFFTVVDQTYEQLAKMKKDALVFYRLGEISQNRKDPNKAIWWYEKALECSNRDDYKFDGRSLVQAANDGIAECKRYLNS